MASTRQLIHAYFAITVLGLVSLFAFSDAPSAQTSAPVSSADRAELARSSPLGEMFLGAEDSSVTFIEYASLKCRHCANFFDEVFPKFKEQYIDTGKVRYILREVATDPVDAAAFLLARCAANGDKKKYFTVIASLLRQQDRWKYAKPLPPLREILAQAGLNEQGFDACLNNQAALDKFLANNIQVAKFLAGGIFPSCSSMRKNICILLFIRRFRKYQVLPTAISNLDRKE